MSKDWVYTSSTNSRCRILKAVKPLQSFCSKCYPANKTSQSVNTETSSVQFLYIEQWRPAFLVWVSLGNKREREREGSTGLSLSSLSPLWWWWASYYQSAPSCQTSNCCISSEVRFWLMYGLQPLTKILGTLCGHPAPAQHTPGSGRTSRQRCDGTPGPAHSLQSSDLSPGWSKGGERSDQVW